MAKTKLELIYLCTLAGKYFSNISGSKVIPSSHPLWTQQERPVCVTGNVENHKLIRLAIERKTNLFVGRYLGTPPPVTASAWYLQMSRLNVLPASVGGWKRLSEAGARHYLTNSRNVNMHPAYPALAWWRSQLGENRRKLPALSAVRVLTTLGDPRWHADPRGLLSRPGDFLRRVLGFRDNVLELSRIAANRGDAALERRQFADAIGLGSCQHAILQLAGLCGPHGLSDVYHPQDGIVGAAEMFPTGRHVWSCFRMAHGLEECLIEFLRLVLSVWLDATDDRTLFVPEYYFADAAAADHYRRFCATLTTGISET